MFDDNHKKGYEAGQQDGITGKKRLIFRPLQRLAKPDALLFGFNNRFSEYWQAYNQGFEDKIRTIQTTTQEQSSTMKNNNESPRESINVPSQNLEEKTLSPTDAIIHKTASKIKQTLSNQLSQSKQGGYMSNPQIDQQIAILEDLKRNFDNVRQHLTEANKNYKKSVQDAYEAGMLVDFHKELDDIMQATYQKISNAEQSIEAGDMATIGKMIDKWEGLR